MTERIFNFSAGPAILPLPVLERAREEIISFRGTGMSVMELSHRSSIFGEVLDAAEAGLRRLLSVPDNFRILFMQCGATSQFSIVPINFLASEGTANYIVTGAWGKKAFIEAKRRGQARIAYTTEEKQFTSIPEPSELKIDPTANYVHYTSNETIEGVEFKYDLDGGDVPVVCDASSNILSKPIEIERYALIYAGAQKNIGPSGVTVVIIRDDMISRVPEGLPPMMDYRLFAEHHSMPNTPNTWGIYLIGLVCDWLESQGGLQAMARKNRDKAERVYDAIDTSVGFYTGHADAAARSNMNVTFRLPTADLEQIFISEATAIGLDGLKGHRSLGGIRASIYNAFPVEGVDRLVSFMSDFARRNG